MSNFIGILFTFLTIFPVHAEPVSCEADLSVPDRVAASVQVDGAFPLDAGTMKDLGLMKLAYPVLEKYLRTDLGKNRLKFLLANPSVDADYLSRRQAAIKALVADPQLRALIRARLDRMQAAGASDLPQFMQELSAFHPSGSRPYFVSSIVAAGVPAAALAAAIGEISWRSLATLPVMMVYAGTANVTAQDQSRDRLLPLKSAVALADTVNARLGDSTSSVLQDIGRALSAVRAPDHQLQLAGVGGSIRRMAGSALGKFGGLTFLINGFTHHLRGKVLANLDALEVLLGNIADLDFLTGIAEFAATHEHDYVFPELLPTGGPTRLRIVDGHHPFLLDKYGEGSVVNDVDMDANANALASRFLLLTGPNTGGKSTYLRMLATNIVLAQIGAPVPARAMSLTPLALISNMKIEDALEEGQSSFYAQALRVAHLLRAAESQKHVLVLMDEILNGTSPEEHTAIERGTIKYLVRSRYVSILATHDRKLQILEQEVPGVVNIHVDDKAKATFKIKKGPSETRNALQVLREVKFPQMIIDEARSYLSSIGIEE